MKKAQKIYDEYTKSDDTLDKAIGTVCTEFLHATRWRYIVSTGFEDDFGNISRETLAENILPATYNASHAVRYAIAQHDDVVSKCRLPRR